MKHRKRAKNFLALAALVLALAAGFACSRPSVETAADAVYPAASWERIAEPSSAGFSAEALDAIHPYVEGISTSAVMAVVGGRVLFEHGPVDSLSYLASVRKSILAMLYGNYVEDGTIDLGLTLEDLGMDDVQGLLPIEKRARVLDLVTARSGVYHPASNAGDNLADAPPRGFAGAGGPTTSTATGTSTRRARSSSNSRAATSTTRWRRISPCRSGSRTGTGRSTASRATSPGPGTSPTT